LPIDDFFLGNGVFYFADKKFTGNPLCFRQMKYQIFNLLKARPIILTGCSLAVLLWSSAAFCQRNSFTNFGIEDGLMQSQVTRILQDNTHQLVITTYLGMNRFDGKTFAAVTKGDFLPDSASSAAIDQSGRIWCSNAKGLFYIYGDKTTRFAGAGEDSIIIASQLIADRHNNVWGLRRQRLFKISGGRLQYINVTGGHDTIAAISINKNGALFAAVADKGIFCLENDRWINVTGPILLKGASIRQFVAANNGEGLFYISTGRELLSVSNHLIKKVNIDFQKDGVNLINCITPDADEGLWIGTNKGAYYLHNNDLKYFDESNGLTNYHVYDIFRDIDNNMWFGTNGAGLFRFDGDAFSIFDHSQGITEPILQMASDKDGNVLMSGGSRLLICDGKKIKPLNIPGRDSVNNAFHYVYTDQEKNTWIVTQKQLFEKNGFKITCFYPQHKNDAKISFNAMLEDRFKTLWFVTGSGCYYWDKGFKKISGADAEYTELLEIGRDSMVVAGGNGVFLVKDKKVDHSFTDDFLKGERVMCMKYYEGRIYVGTLDHGLFIWNPNGGPVTRLTDKNGLSSISVYCVDVDKNGVLWVGTGRAINHFKIGAGGALKRILDDDFSNLFVECNEQALLFNKDQVWMGTTKGVFVFKNNLALNAVSAPYTTIQDVQFYNKQTVDSTYKNGYNQPRDLKLPFDNSHITLSFNGIYLKNPAGVSYSYKLWPVDSRYSRPQKNNVVDYPSLPPGSYVFYVKSYSLAGVASNIASFSFEITPAYYQTTVFKVAMVLLLLSIGVLTWKYLRTKEEQKRRMIAQLRLEEQVKIRKQTAEDFHDDLGNKLTRINVLSDVLYKKIDVGLSDQRKLIDQIKENADALFAGSKHILWALDPDNDRLSEVLTLIKEFGIDLFLNTPINFTSDLTDDVFKEIILPMGYGRNIILVFKELFNNSLRHSGAENVKAVAFVNRDNKICITAEDDGKGFDADTIKSGNGLRNINNRAKKMNGVIEISSSIGRGTSITLVIYQLPTLH
jgi:signal transduction histidine kinase/ligand-binding sensor domain-containing protein